MDLNDLIVTANPMLSANELAQTDLSANPPLNKTQIDAQQSSEKRSVPLSDGELAQVLQETIDKLRQFSQIQSKNVDFSIEKFDGLSVVVVSDSQTKEILRQIPSEEMIEVSKKIERSQLEILNSSSGILFDKKI
jgi:flagellar protein FlaG